jgi:chromate transporter
MMQTLIDLGLIFSQLSLLAFGGGNTTLPEMQRQVVQVHHWMTTEEFSALFALAQAAPGPNLMVVPLVGWHVAGAWGVLVTSIAKFGPSSLVTVTLLGLWDRFKNQPWRIKVQAGLRPVTVGLVSASAILMVEATTHTWLLGAIVAGVALLASQTQPVYIPFYCWQPVAWWH